MFCYRGIPEGDKGNGEQAGPSKGDAGGRRRNCKWQFIIHMLARLSDETVSVNL